MVHVDILDLFVYMFTGKSVGELKYNCTYCGTASTSATKVTSLFTITHKRHNSIQEHIDASNNKTKKCSHCGKDSSRTYRYNSVIVGNLISIVQMDSLASKVIIRMITYILSRRYLLTKTCCGVVIFSTMFMYISSRTTD